jgi:hypothetical protein
MDGLSFDEKVEAGEEVECAVDPERLRYLRRSGAGKGSAKWDRRCPSLR